MEITLLHGGIILAMFLVGGFFAFEESAFYENKYLNTIIFSFGGAAVGFFLYYVFVFFFYYVIALLIIALIAFMFKKRKSTEIITTVAKDGTQTTIKKVTF